MQRRQLKPRPGRPPAAADGQDSRIHRVDCQGRAPAIARICDEVVCGLSQVPNWVICARHPVILRRVSHPNLFGDLLAVRDELAGTIVTLGDRPWSQVRARRASFPALVPVWVSSGFPVPAELGEQSGERSGMPGVPEIPSKALLTCLAA